MNAELAGQINAGLVGEAHADIQRCRLAAHEIDRFVAFHTYSVAGPMGQAWQFVIGSVTPARVRSADRVIDTSGGLAKLRRGIRYLLSPGYLVPNLPLLSGRIGVKDEGA